MKATVITFTAIIVAATAAPIGPYKARSSPVVSYTSGYDDSVYRSNMLAASRDAGIIELDGAHSERNVLSSNVRIPAIRGRVPVKLEVVVDVSPDFL